ncbi:MAG: 23S rRNA (uridine(2552)-2'-O)-methyltransferase [Candidatus Binatia bacterium]|nr:MAG: 23S rRNA (uridine(2552)-2'-O)-methyltransferase [Candidatus Binatia bacterium]
MSRYRRKDAYYAQAKAAGLRSRAAYKLEQLQKHYKLLGRGDKVVDLGAWPGGWLQVAARIVGPQGKVIGVDSVRIPPLPEAPQVTTLEADVFEPELAERVRRLLGGEADAVLSDLAPKLSGIKDRDQAQALALVERAAELAREWLRPGGVLVAKAFMGEDLPQVLKTLRQEFTNVMTTRPEATRKGSSELYVIARKPEKTSA